jgi:hypothetical protein
VLPPDVTLPPAVGSFTAGFLIRVVRPQVGIPAKTAPGGTKVRAELRDFVPDRHSAMDYLRDQTYV